MLRGGRSPPKIVSRPVLLERRNLLVAHDQSRSLTQRKVDILNACDSHLWPGNAPQSKRGVYKAFDNAIFQRRS